MGITVPIARAVCSACMYIRAYVYTYAFHKPTQDIFLWRYVHACTIQYVLTMCTHILLVYDHNIVEVYMYSNVLHTGGWLHNG